MTYLTRGQLEAELMTVKKPENTWPVDKQGMIIKSLRGVVNYHFKSRRWHPPVALDGENLRELCKKMGKVEGIQV